VSGKLRPYQYTVVSFLKLGISTTVAVVAFFISLIICVSIGYTEKTIVMSAGFIGAVLAAIITLYFSRYFEKFESKKYKIVYFLIGIILFFLAVYFLYKGVGY